MFETSPRVRPRAVKSANTASSPNVQMFWKAAEKRMPR